MRTSTSASSGRRRSRSYAGRRRSGSTSRTTASSATRWGQRVDCRAWWHYSFARLGGIGAWADAANVPMAPPERTVALGQFHERRDWTIFRRRYSDPEAGVVAMASSSEAAAEIELKLSVCAGPLPYAGQAEIQRSRTRGTSATSTGGRSDRTYGCRRARCSFPASSATRPT